MAFEQTSLSWKDTEGASRPAVRITRPPIPVRRRRVNPLVTALVWLIGAVMLFSAGLTFVQWRSRAAAEYIARVQREADVKAQQEAQLKLREAAEREAQRIAAVEAQNAQRSATIAEKDRADEAARRAVTEEADRKTKAWAKFYRKPSVCNDASTLECANAYIRAQRTFEQKWAKGQL